MVWLFLIQKKTGGWGPGGSREVLQITRLFTSFLRPSLYESVPRGPHGYDSAFLADFVFYFAGCQTVKGLNVLLPSNWTQEKIHFWISSTKIFETAKQT